MYSATYRRELNKTVARESAHLWAQPEVQNEAFVRKIGGKAPSAAARKTPRKSKTTD